MKCFVVLLIACLVAQSRAQEAAPGAMPASETIPMKRSDLASLKTIILKDGTVKKWDEVLKVGDTSMIVFANGKAEILYYKDFPGGVESPTSLPTSAGKLHTAQIMGWKSVVKADGSTVNFETVTSVKPFGFTYSSRSTGMGTIYFKDLPLSTQQQINYDSSTIIPAQVAPAYTAERPVFQEAPRKQSATQYEAESRALNTDIDNLRVRRQQYQRSLSEAEKSRSIDRLSLQESIQVIDATIIKKQNLLRALQIKKQQSPQ